MMPDENVPLIMEMQASLGSSDGLTFFNLAMAYEAVEAYPVGPNPRKDKALGQLGTTLQDLLHSVKENPKVLSAFETYLLKRAKTVKYSVAAEQSKGVLQ